MRSNRWLVLAVLMVLVAAGIIGAYRFCLSALPEPGRTETWLATRAKRWLVGRSAREVPAPPIRFNAFNATIGGMTFRGQCANCHGLDGRVPTEIGRWMYPRALDLSSPEVQRWSDGELFWIVKNGIRLSGMPGFGKTQSDEQIWQIVSYIRSLSKQLPQ